MRTITRRYSKREVAAAVAERLVATTFKDRLVKNGWLWEVRGGGPLLTARDLNEIQDWSGSDASGLRLLTLVGQAFKLMEPLLQYELTSDGFRLAVDQGRNGTEIVIEEMPPCFCGYEYDARRECFDEVVANVRSTIKLAVARHRCNTGSDEWLLAEGHQVCLIYGVMYEWIKDVGDFGYCRTKNVIEFMREAAPDLFDEWEQAGLVLTPAHNMNTMSGECYTTLQLSHKTPV